MQFSYETSYGMARPPFGPLRTKIVEFIAQSFQVFPKESHGVMYNTGLYDTLLFFFEAYPFHNILHQKVCEIFITALEKNQNEYSALLDSTTLLQRILEISNH